VEGRRNHRIEMLRGESDRLEEAEDWDGVFKKLGEVLNVDGGLVFARAGRDRARALAELHKRIEFFLAEPKLLQSERGGAEAMGILADAKEGHPGPKLKEKSARLQAMVDAATAVIPLELTSDGATQVAIFKKGQFPPFARQTVEMRPGTWTVVGTRAGYRDVRMTLELKAGDSGQTLDVRCSEKVR
jgi:hypothetical protein